MSNIEYPADPPICGMCHDEETLTFHQKDGSDETIPCFYCTDEGRAQQQAIRDAAYQRLQEKNLREV